MESISEGTLSSFSESKSKGREDYLQGCKIQLMKLYIKREMLFIIVLLV